MPCIAYHDEELTEALARVADALTDTTPLGDAFGETLLESTLENLADHQGVKRASRSPATLIACALQGKRYGHARFTAAVAFFRFTRIMSTGRIGSRGDRTACAAVQQFGHQKGVFGTTRTGSALPCGDVPARPFPGLGGQDQVSPIETGNGFLRTALGE